MSYLLAYNGTKPIKGGMKMSKQLPNLSWWCAWTSHMGALKGCLDYLQLPVSPGWLFGGTGHAFILNIDPTGCPSGPTAWRTEMLFELGNNLGYTVTGAWAMKGEPDFQRKQLLAWEHAKRAIDAGLPCYGWELDIPEYYVINGYSETEYLYNGCTTGEATARRQWDQLGLRDTGMLEVYSVEPGQAAAAPIVLKEALQFALEHATSPDKWVFAQYKSGLAGFDNWLTAVNAEQPNLMGLAYNAAVWHECRQYAVEFLQEAREKIGGDIAPLLQEAEQHYADVAGKLAELKALYPFPPQPEAIIANQAQQATACLTQARDAEAKGLQSLEAILQELVLN